MITILSKFLFKKRFFRSLCIHNTGTPLPKTSVTITIVNLELNKFIALISSIKFHCDMFLQSIFRKKRNIISFRSNFVYLNNIPQMSTNVSLSRPKNSLFFPKAGAIWVQATGVISTSHLIEHKGILSP